jgi:hypothetical protein
MPVAPRIGVHSPLTILPPSWSPSGVARGANAACHGAYPTASSPMSNTSFAFGGITPGTPLSRYAR